LIRVKLLELEVVSTRREIMLIVGRYAYF